MKYSTVGYTENPRGLTPCLTFVGVRDQVIVQGQDQLFIGGVVVLPDALSTPYIYYQNHAFDCIVMLDVTRALRISGVFNGRLGTNFQTQDAYLALTSQEFYTNTPTPFKCILPAQSTQIKLNMPTSKEVSGVTHVTIPITW